MFKGLERALADLRDGNIVCPYECNLRIKSMYNWQNISARTDIVYERVIKDPVHNIGQQLKRYKKMEVKKKLCFYINFNDYFSGITEVACGLFF